MFSVKYQPNQSSGSGEKNRLNVFIIHGHGGYLEFRIITS